MPATASRVTLVSVLFVALAASCSHQRQPDPLANADPVQRLAFEASTELDRVAADLEEYGTISVSAAPLIRDPQGMFAFNLPMSAREMFAYNLQVEGSSVQTDVEAQNIAIRAGYGSGSGREEPVDGRGRSAGASSVGGTPGGASSSAGGAPSGGSGSGGSRSGASAASGAASSGGSSGGGSRGGGTSASSGGTSPGGSTSGGGSRSGGSPSSGGPSSGGGGSSARGSAGTSSGAADDATPTARSARGGEAAAGEHGRDGGRSGIDARGADGSGSERGRDGGDHRDGRAQPEAADIGLGPWPPNVVLLPPAVPRRSPASYALRLSDLLNLTANDYVRKQVLEWTSSPDQRSLGDNKVLLAAVLTVSVRPGSRTSAGYIGEIDVRVQYARKEGEDIVPAPATRHPLAFAIFPGLDSQVLDLEASKQRQQTLSVLLEAATAQASGGVKADLFRLLGHDLGAVTALNTVVGYNMSGRHFGWHFYPRIQAQADPASMSSGPGRVLQPQSFPALVFILMDKSDLPPALWGTGARSAMPVPARPAAEAPSSATDVRPSRPRGMAETLRGGDGGTEPADDLLRGYTDLGPFGSLLGASGPVGAGAASRPAREVYDHLIFRLATRWIPAQAPEGSSSGGFVFPWSGGSRAERVPRMSEQHFVAWACQLASVRQKVDRAMRLCRPAGGAGASPEPGDGEPLPAAAARYDMPLLRTLENRLYMLEAATIGTDVAWAIPAPVSDR
jgi:hypothetical protein